MNIIETLYWVVFLAVACFLFFRRLLAILYSSRLLANSFLWYKSNLLRWGLISIILAILQIRNIYRMVKSLTPIALQTMRHTMPKLILTILFSPINWILRVEKQRTYTRCTQNPWISLVQLPFFEYHSQWLFQWSSWLPILLRPSRAGAYWK